MTSAHLAAQIILQAALVKDLHAAVPVMSSTWALPIILGGACIAVALVAVGLKLFPGRVHEDMVPAIFLAAFMGTAIVAIPIVTTMLPSPKTIAHDQDRLADACRLAMPMATMMQPPATATDAEQKWTEAAWESGRVRKSIKTIDDLCAPPG